jgi:hypothetical protein
MTSPLTPFLAAALDVFEPLEQALHDADGFTQLLRDVGWAKTVDDAALAHGGIIAVAESATDLLESGRRLLADLGNGSDGDAGQDGSSGPALLELLDVLARTRDLVDDLRNLDTSGLPAALADPALWAALALDLPDYLLARYLERQHRVLYALLRAVGVIIVESWTPDADDSDVGPGSGRVPYLQRTIVWGALGDLAGDPAGYLAKLYHWGDRGNGQPFRHVAALDALARIAASTGVRFERLELRPKLVDDLYGGHQPEETVHELTIPVLKGVTASGFAEHGVLLAPAPSKPDGDIDSLVLTNLTWGHADASTDIISGWVLEVTGQVDATAVLGVRLSPGGVSVLSAPPDQRYELAVQGTPAEPWHLIGGPGGTRLDVGGLRLSVAVKFGTGEPEVVVGAATVPAGDQGGLALIVDPGDADAFLRSLLPGPLQVDADLAIQWSSRTGVTLSGGGLCVTVPLTKTIGPLAIYNLSICIASDGGIVSMPISATLGSALGPFALLVQDLGLKLELQPGAEDALLAGLGVAAGFKPPDAIGFSLDIAGVVSGGGVVGLQPEIGRWWGGLAFDFVTVGLEAVVIVDTRLPGDADAWSFFASISATFPSLPLGFGFFLSGVGGLICLNRAIDTDALATGLRDGAIDALLFPDDPVADAPLIAASLDDWFPAAPGSSVFAVAAEIDWGAPVALVRGQFGVAVTLPETEITLLGSLSIVLPDETAPELELHLDSLGEIDTADGTVWVRASLYDSTLIGAFKLSGDMAAYVSVLNQPYFLLAVGGYHPAFSPPGYLPPAVTELERMAFEVDLSDDIWLGVAGYVAVTANTLQFGAEATLEASTEFLLTTYTATGSAGFDVLLTFSPFSFVADVHVSVEVSADGKELWGADLAVHLEGPKPWYATVRGSVDFFGIDVPFDLSIGAAEAVEAPPRANVLDDVATALGAVASWREVAPASAAVQFAADPEPPAGDAQDTAPLRVRPDADVQARQSVAPLDRELDIYGVYAIDGPALLTLDAAGIGDPPGGDDWQPVQDWFAPAQFDVMTRTEKLAAPSYEEMTAGALITATGVDTGLGATSVTPDPEVRILEPDTTRDIGRVPFDSPLDVAAAPVAIAARTAAGTSVPRRAVSPAFGVGEPSWTRIDQLTGAAVGAAGTYRATLDQLRTRRAADPGARMAPVAAARTAR